MPHDKCRVLEIHARIHKSYVYIAVGLAGALRTK